MSRLDIRIPPAIPEEFAPQQISTSEPYIANRTIVEFRPHNDVEVNLNSSGSNILEFILNSRDGFMDNTDSYIEIMISARVTQTVGATLWHPDIFNLAFCTGGVHGMLRNIKGSDEAGVVADEVPEYGTFYASYANICHSKAFTDTQGPIWGDANDRQYEKEAALRPFLLRGLFSISVTGATSTLVLAGVAAGTAGDSALDLELAVGDLVVIYDTTLPGAASLSQTYIGVVSVVTSSIAASVIVNGVADVAPSAAYRVYKLGYPKEGLGNMETATISTDAVSARIIGAGYKTTDALSYVRFMFKPQLGLFRHEKYFPLRYLRNFRLTLEFYAPWQMVCSNHLSQATTKTYDIYYKNARFVASMVQPVEEVLAAWDERYRSDQGLVYSYPSVYCTIMPDTGSTSATIVIPCKVASARGIITVTKHVDQMVRDDAVKFITTNTTGAGGGSLGYDKTGDSISANISSYYYQIGTERYPLRRPVEVSNFGLENFLYNLQCMGHMNVNDVSLASSRIKPADIRLIHPTPEDLACGRKYGNNSTVNQSIRCYLTADFAKEGFLTGANLRDADLILNITRAAWTGGTLYLHNFVMFDNVLKISAMSSGVQRYF